MQTADSATTFNHKKTQTFKEIIFFYQAKIFSKTLFSQTFNLKTPTIKQIIQRNLANK